MTGNSDKVRSLILTALMVFSVFAGTIAFSGGAAAAANVEIDQATEYEAGGSTDTIEIALNNSLNNGVSSVGGTGDDVTLYLDGDVDPFSGATVTDSGTSGTIVIETGEDITPDENLTVKVNDVSAGTETTTLRKKDIDVTSTTISPDGNGLGVADSNVVNVYRGESIAVESTGSNIEVDENDGGIITDDSFTANSDVYVLDTGDLDTGQNYNITIDQTDEAGFQVNDLNLQVEMDDNDITTEDDVIANVTLRRGGEDANVTLFDSDDDKVQTIIEEDLSGNDVNSVNFGNISSIEGFDDGDGPYTVNVTDRPTGVSVTSDPINVSESDDGDVSFESSVVSDEQGDVVNITYQLNNEDEAVVFVGDDDDDNYAISGEIEDDDGDGEVTVQFNSYLAGLTQNSSNNVDAGDILYVKGDDDIDNVEEGGSFGRDTLAEETIEPASYNLNATAGTTVESNADSVGTLRLNERSTENIRSWTAPQDAELTDDDIDIYDRVGANLTQSDDIADGDLIVHQIVASGIEGPLAYEKQVNGSADTSQAFIRSLGGEFEDENKAFNLTANRSDVGANADEDPLDLNSSNLVVVEDPDNNTYFVAVETQEASFESGQPIREDDEDDEITANFTVRGDSGLADGDNDGVEDAYSIVDRDASIDTTNGIVTLQAAAGQEVTGTTSIAPGSEIEVRLESESDSNPFITRPETEVNSDGTWNATVDFSEQSAGTNFTVDFLDVDGDTLGDEEDGVITDAATATVSISDQESDGSEVVVDSAQLSEGGFIAVHDGSLLEGDVEGSVVGNSEYLEAGSHEDVTITLDEPMDENFTAIAMPHLDTNGNETYDFPDADGPYTANGSAVTASANVTVSAEPPETETEPPETETEPPETETEPPETETEPMDTETEATTTAAEGPGFTAAIALIALVAAALLAVRRDN